MNHNSITDDYLVGVARRGPRTSEVLDLVRDSTLDHVLGALTQPSLFPRLCRGEPADSTSTSCARP